MDIKQEEKFKKEVIEVYVSFGVNLGKALDCFEKDVFSYATDRYSVWPLSFRMCKDCSICSCTGRQFSQVVLQKSSFLVS